jgi:hypothetical protein
LAAFGLGPGFFGTGASAAGSRATTVLAFGGAVPLASNQPAPSGFFAISPLL